MSDQHGFTNDSKWGHPCWRAEARPLGAGGPRPGDDHGDHQGPGLLKVHERLATGGLHCSRAMFDPVFHNVVTFDCASKVTARGGRPVLICEEGDAETQRLNPDNCLTIPHTVDCLQVVVHIANSLKLNTQRTSVESFCCREFSASFRYSCSLITWPSSSKYLWSLWSAEFLWSIHFALQGLQRWLPAKPGQVGYCRVNQELQMAFLTFFCELSELSSLFALKHKGSAQWNDGFWKFQLCTLRGRCCVDVRLSSKNKFARWNSENSWKPTLKDSISTWHTMVMWWWSRLTRQNCGTTCVLKWAQEIGSIAGLCLNFTDGQFLDQKFAFRFLSRTRCTLRNP